MDITESSNVIDAVAALDPSVRAGEAAAAAAVAAGETVRPTLSPTDLTAAAFFDVDNTMMVGASIFHFARGLAARKFFTTSDMLGFVWHQLKFPSVAVSSATATPRLATPPCRSSRAVPSRTSSSSAKKSTTS